VSCLDTSRGPYAYLLLDLAKDTDDLRINIFPSEVTIVQSPVDDETNTVELSPLTSYEDISPRLRKNTIENSDGDLVRRIFELAQNVLNGNCIISSTAADRLANTRPYCEVWSTGDRSRQEEECDLQRGVFLLSLMTELSALPSLIRL